MFSTSSGQRLARFTFLIAFCGLLVGSLFFKDQTATIVTRICGLIMVALVALLKKGGSDSAGKGHASGLSPLKQNFVSAIGIVASLVLGVMIYIIPEGVSVRKPIIVVAVIVMAGAFLVSYRVRRAS